MCHDDDWFNPEPWLVLPLLRFPGLIPRVHDKPTYTESGIVLS